MYGKDRQRLIYQKWCELCSRTLFPNFKTSGAAAAPNPASESRARAATQARCNLKTRCRRLLPRPAAAGRPALLAKLAALTLAGITSYPAHRRSVLAGAVRPRPAGLGRCDSARRNLCLLRRHFVRCGRCGAGGPAATDPRGQRLPSGGRPTAAEVWAHVGRWCQRSRSRRVEVSHATPLLLGSILVRLAADLLSAPGR